MLHLLGSGNASVADLGMSQAWFLGQIVQHRSRRIQHLHCVVEELGALTADGQRPPVLAKARLVEVCFLLGGRGRPEQAAESANESEIDLGSEVPVRLKVLRLQPIYEVHGGDEARLSSGAAYIHKIRVCRCRIEGLHNPAVQRDLSCEVCEMEVSFDTVNTPEQQTTSTIHLPVEDKRFPVGLSILVTAGNLANHSFNFI